MSLRDKLAKWFRLYLLALSVTLVVIMLGTLLFATWMSKPFLDVLRWTMMIGIFVLIGIGFVSLLPLSEYSYMGGPRGRGRFGGANPAVIVGVKSAGGRRGSKEIGIVLGIVGLTLLLIYFFLFPW